MRLLYGWKLPLLGLAGMVFAVVSIATRKEPEPNVPVAPPPQATIATHVAGIGVVEPKSETIAIGVELPGVVRRVYIKVGDRVRYGTPLFSLDQRAVDAEIVRLEAALAARQVQAADAAAQYARIASVKDARAVSRDEVSQRRYARDLAQAHVKELRAQLAEARTTKARLAVKAPIDGEVLRVNVRPGEYASAGQLTEPLMRMGDTSRLYVRVELDEEFATRLSAEQSAQAIPRGATTERIPLEFVRIEPLVLPKQNLAVAGQRVDTRVLQVLYALPKDLQGSYVGQQMDVFIGDANPAPSPTRSPAEPSV
jgi:HlyD family secretion protein